MPEARTQSHFREFSCGGCGSSLEFQPGAAVLVCRHCGTETPLADADGTIEELDLGEWLASLEQAEETEEVLTAACCGCGARVERDTRLSADTCPFCGTTIVAEGGSHKRIKPRSLLPFKVDRGSAVESFRRWVSKRWFAPNDFKERVRLDTALSGIYIPYWTFDAAVTTRYTGRRGTVRQIRSNGKTVTRTSWTPVSGTVHDAFDDLLVPATRSLPYDHLEELEPWDLSDLIPFHAQYMSGFRAESYQIGLEEGFAEAREQMDGLIRETIKRDIGGDRQQIRSMRSDFKNLTFKHILLPVWISVYRYRNKSFRFLVNARTGETQGERPWSLAKVAITAVLAVVLAALLLALEYAPFLLDFSDGL